MRGLLLALALASFALPIAAQTPCDADPRWIVVTVVRFEWTNADGQRNVALTDIVLGELLFDRCEGQEVTMDEPREREQATQSLSLGVAQTRIVVRLGSGDRLTYYVLESLHDICAAVDDCGDATIADRGDP